MGSALQAPEECAWLAIVSRPVWRNLVRLECCRASGRVGEGASLKLVLLTNGLARDEGGEEKRGACDDAASLQVPAE